MKRAFASFLLLFLACATTDAFAVADYLTREHKCPKCKMKIEKRGACPCCLKRTVSRSSFIHDPCASDDGDLTLRFDRVNALHSVEIRIAITTVSAAVVSEQASFFSTTPDTPSPPPRL